MGGGLLGTHSFSVCLLLMQVCSLGMASGLGSHRCFQVGGFFANTVAAAAAKSIQSHPTLCNPIDDSPLGSAVPGILQARILEWVAISC